MVTHRRLQSSLVPSFSSIVATGVCVLKSIMVSVEGSGYHVSLSWVRSMLSARFGVPPLVLWWWCICGVSLVASRLVWCVIVACCICEFASDSVVIAVKRLKAWSSEQETDFDIEFQKDKYSFSSIVYEPLHKRIDE
ncbi:hypothetical protein HID58_093984 [Brassica napus]|uniref:Uncharacterized protein n=3 Tax=Brassica TaxID=3705 RepID=A0ABQ7X948_BRANA|nr:hypothetical protein HID58_093984 [Brassica napus]CAG7875449.1 unnamed protein product [Brassica rapa]